METTDRHCSGTAEDNRGNRPGARICHLTVPDWLRGVQIIFGWQPVGTVGSQQSKKPTDSRLDGLVSL